MPRSVRKLRGKGHLPPALASDTCNQPQAGNAEGKHTPPRSFPATALGPLCFIPNPVLSQPPRSLKLSRSILPLTLGARPLRLWPPTLHRLRICFCLLTLPLCSRPLKTSRRGHSEGLLGRTSPPCNQSRSHTDGAKWGRKARK